MEGSNGKMIALLERIADRLDSMQSDMNRGFDQINARIDNVISFSGNAYGDHETRIRALEEHVLGKPG